MSAYRRFLPLLLCTVATLLASAHPTWAQDNGDEAPPISIGDSSVGYVDGAIPATQMRMRFDFAKGINTPNRAEFLWAWPPPAGSGPPLDESNVDYQSMTLYLEQAISPCLSGFVELGGLSVNPDVNPNTSGLGDLQAGVKWAFWQDCDTMLTFQLRAYAPTGDEERALGVGHASLEPGLLLFKRCCQYNFEGELRYWIPIDGTPGREGDVLRYGAAVSREYCLGCCHPVTPVVELVGWTVLDGQVRFLSQGAPVVEEADGDTIVNIKIGARTPITPCSEIYAGYGHSLTGDRWYRDILRLEWRRRF